MKHSILLLTSGILLSACSNLAESNYTNRGTPESLLDVSVEQVTIPLDSAAGIDNLISAVNQQQPSHASLQCAMNDMLCTNARRVLEQFAVPAVEEASAAGNQVVLVYEQLMARDCDSSYVDNTINPYNLNHPSFGCANAANMVQMVSDKRQFTNPALLGYTDGSKARQSYQGYMTKTDPAQSESKSLLDTVNTD